MASLFGLLHLGANALQAQQAGVAVTSNNVANAATPGYSRQRIDLQSQLGAPLVGGVGVGGIDRMASSLLAGRMRSNGSSLSVAEAFSSALLDLEAAMTVAGSDLGGLAAGFFARVSQVAAAPGEQGLRDAAVQAARDLAVGLQRQAAEVANARADANERIRQNVQEANRLISELARANQAVLHTGDPVARDHREATAQKLSELVGGTARVDPDGHMRVTMSGGETLVDGVRGVQLTSSPDAALGNMDRIEVLDGPHRRDVTALIDGGRIAGDLRMRDQVATQTLGQLDQLAFDLATQVNQVHQANAGLDGQTGRNLFVQPTQVAGAAAAMAVDPAVLADSSLLATAAPGAGPGDNQGALALFGLRDQRLADGGRRTFVDASIQIPADVGRAAADAAVDRDFHTAQAQFLSGLRDSISGVSLQEEMTNLSQFQHAAEAQLQFLSTVDELLGSIIQGL